MKAPLRRNSLHRFLKEGDRGFFQLMDLRGLRPDGLSRQPEAEARDADVFAAVHADVNAGRGVVCSCTLQIIIFLVLQREPAVNCENSEATKETQTWDRRSETRHQQRPQNRGG